jgi:hypothetical protein
MHKANLRQELLPTPLFSVDYDHPPQPLVGTLARKCKAEKPGKKTPHQGPFPGSRSVQHAGFHSVRDQMRIGMTT